MFRELGVACFWRGRSQGRRPCFGWFLWMGVAFRGVPSMFWEVFVDEGGVLGCGCVVHVWAVSWLAGHGVLCSE